MKNEPVLRKVWTKSEGVVEMVCGLFGFGGARLSFGYLCLG
jgi:hypothetical protein